jgi:hypothetical protein
MGNVVARAVARAVGEWAWNVIGERRRTWARLRRIDGGGGWWWWQLPQIRPTATMMMIVMSEYEAQLARILRRCDAASSRLGAAAEPNLVEYELVSSDALASITEDEAERLLEFIGTAYYDGIGDGPGRVLWVRDQDREGASYLRYAYLQLPREVGPVGMRCHCQRANKRESVSIYVRGEDPVATGDALLLILGRARGFRRYLFTAMPSTGPFPVSVEALQAFLRDIQDRRRPMHADRDAICEACYSYTKVAFEMTGLLSEAQKLVLAFECQRNIHLEVWGSCWRGGSGIGPLAEAVERDMCPAQLTIFGSFETQMGTLRTAFASNTCVESVTSVWGCVRDLRQLLLLNTGLRQFHLLHGLPELGEVLGPADWDIFWDAVATHPTLQVLDLGDGELSGYPAAQLEQMAQSLRSSSTSLQYICTRKVYRPILRDQGGRSPCSQAARSCPRGATTAPSKFRSFEIAYCQFCC